MPEAKNGMFSVNRREILMVAHHRRRSRSASRRSKAGINGIVRCTRGISFSHVASRSVLKQRASSPDLLFVCSLLDRELDSLINVESTISQIGNGFGLGDGLARV